MTDQPEKSLVEKLGFKPGDTIFVETTPGWYSGFADENELEMEAGLPATHAHIFVRSRSELGIFLRENDLSQIEQSLWICWPKKAGKQKSDLSDQVVRTIVLPLGWVDTKVASMDEEWSGLKFVRRKG